MGKATMKYQKTIKLKDGRTCCLRNAAMADGEAVLAIFMLTHEQTDFLLSYPDENTMTVMRKVSTCKRKRTVRMG